MIDDLPGARQGAPRGWYAVAGFAMRVIVDRLSKTYRDRSGQEVAALEDVALRVEPEEFVAVLGPSGCGKSTLLGIMAGLLPATSGQVFFEGARRGGQPLTATVFQEFALFPWRTVQGNVEFGLEELGAAPAERKERAARFIAMTGLEGFEGKFPHQLSGGMRQRVGIARALAVDPAVLLMDEPFSALDAQTRTLMMEELLGIWERTRTSIVYVTHNIQEAVYMADRVVVFSRRPGRVLDVVPIELERPRHEGQMGEPAFVQAGERIWKLIKSQAQAALREGGA
jgi:NitT/TauT family transport system ATP-binding protein